MLKKKPMLIKKNCQLLFDLTPEQKDKIKEALTFDNPLYKQAKRYSRSRYISIPPYLYYYTEGKTPKSAGGEKYVSVPIGVKVEELLECNFDVVDQRTKKEVKYPPFVLELREDQKLAKKAYLKEYTKDNPKCMIQLPTGKGKSILALNIAYELKQKTLILVHKDDLVTGWQKDIDLCFNKELESGLIKAKSRKVGKQITIATVQTLSRMSEEELESYMNDFGLVVQDECLVGDTLITLEDGGVKQIKNVTNDMRVLGGKVSEKFERPSEIVTLEFEHGFISGSPKHRTWCVEKHPSSKKKYSEEDFVIKPIDCLNSDYFIPIKVALPHTTSFKDISKEETRLCVAILMSGHLDKGESNRAKINVAKQKEYYEEIFKEFSLSSNIPYRKSFDCRDNITLWFSDPYIKFSIMCDKWGIPVGKKNPYIEIPEFIFKSPLEIIKTFIETCFSCSGDLGKDKNGYRINFNTTSKVFTMGLSLLLRKFGILSHFQTIKQPNKHSMYRLSIGGKFFNTFMDTFDTTKNTKERNSAMEYNSRICGEYYLSNVKRVIYEDYSGMVYDFTVEETHSFVANGALTHNCHHIGLNIFNVINSFNSHYKIGLSATPKREDGISFAFDLFLGGLGFKYTYDPNDKDITQVKVIIRDSKFRYKPFLYEGMIYNYYDFPEEELPKSIQFLEDLGYKDRPTIPFLEVDKNIVLSKLHKIQVCKDIIREYREGHSCIALFTQKDHIRSYYSYLLHFIPKDQIMLYYGDSKESSEVLTERAEKREVLVTLATYAKATEGTNVKSWEVEFLVSSLNNEKNVEQATGRIRRSKEGKIDPVLVYDYSCPNVYSTSNHINTRKRVYKRLKYLIDTLEEEKPIRGRRGMFSRGYKK